MQARRMGAHSPILAARTAIRPCRKRRQASFARIILLGVRTAGPGETLIETTFFSTKGQSIAGSRFG